MLGDAMFMQAVTVLLGAGLFPAEFVEDRKKMFDTSFDVEVVKRVMPAKRDQLRLALAGIDAQLADGRPFVLGEAASLADFSLYNPMFIMQLAPPTATLLEPFRNVATWRARIAAFGHGRRTEISAEEAVAEARRSKPAPSGAERLQSR
jgi:glutathione S-transferase